ncbi:hypothetical protein PP182_09840 [Maribacter sp. PR1]|uniref:VanZ-like domain-containing protein n=1 Tax=Maribacter cobaltidurans TaxID=1178778 RepID=A0ABU7ITT0_9FLAO|nr:MULTISPECIES: hypothetical protein [Maribacter]MDC6388981.1 hypothetical protein [Maribacter sp. PR1]MEE1976369.1 hypothetical protein [Maribacter cobaltidurans]
MILKKSTISFVILLYAVAVPFLEINDTHVFNPDWTPHAKIHEVWQLLTNSSIGIFCLWLVWVKKELKTSVLISMLVTGGFLIAYSIQNLYGGSMKYLDGSEKTILGLNIGVVGFGVGFILLSILYFKTHNHGEKLNNRWLKGL